LLVAVGLFISGYLTIVKLTSAEILCVDGGMFDCAAVENSQWATMFGIPVAILGLLGYASIGVLLVVEKSLPAYRPVLQVTTFAVVLISWLFSMWLVYVQAIILHAFCQWCLAHELNITVLFGIVIYRLWQALK
jgi:uncharacterized membrane protein